MNAGKIRNAIRRRAKCGNDIIRRCRRVFVKRGGAERGKTEKTHIQEREEGRDTDVRGGGRGAESRAADVMDPARPILLCPVQTSSLMLLLNHHRRRSATPTVANPGWQQPVLIASLPLLHRLMQSHLFRRSHCIFY